MSVTDGQRRTKRGFIIEILLFKISRLRDAMKKKINNFAKEEEVKRGQTENYWLVNQLKTLSVSPESNGRISRQTDKEVTTK